MTSIIHSVLENSLQYVQKTYYSYGSEQSQMFLQNIALQNNQDLPNPKQWLLCTLNIYEQLTTVSIKPLLFTFEILAILQTLLYWKIVFNFHASYTVTSNQLNECHIFIEYQIHEGVRRRANVMNSYIHSKHTINKNMMLV